MLLYKTLANHDIQLGRELGKGGEGTIYEIAGAPDRVAKIYHSNQPLSEKEEKLHSMIANPPVRGNATSHMAMAWPRELVYKHGRFAGYVMPRVANCHSIVKIYNPQFRAKHNFLFDWRQLHRTARNLASAIHALHTHHYIVGDMNQSNILVTSSALVVLIDTDSFQVKDKNGKVYGCHVGVPEYTPPELQGKNFACVERTEPHDRFALGTLIFQLLMQGYHPFCGRSNDREFSVEGETYLHCIQNGILPFHPNSQFTPPANAPHFDVLHPRVQNLFLRCFVNGHTYPITRPNAQEWIDALTISEQALVNCGSNPVHWHLPQFGHCHWCEPGRKRSKSNVTLVQKTPVCAPLPPASAPVYLTQSRPLSEQFVWIVMGFLAFTLVLPALIPADWPQARRYSTPLLQPSDVNVSIDLPPVISITSLDANKPKFQSIIELASRSELTKTQTTPNVGAEQNFAYVLAPVAIPMYLRETDQEMSQTVYDIGDLLRPLPLPISRRATSGKSVNSKKANDATAKDPAEQRSPNASGDESNRLQSLEYGNVRAHDLYRLAPPFSKLRLSLSIASPAVAPESNDRHDSERASMTAFETDGSDSQYLSPIDDDTNDDGHSVDYWINTNIVTNKKHGVDSDGSDE